MHDRQRFLAERFEYARRATCRLDAADEFLDRYDSDPRRRASADMNRRLGDAAALRLNVMAEDSGIAGRDVAAQRSYRIDPAITVAGGIQHVGSSYFGRPDTVDRVIPNGRFGKLPGFTVVNLMASYAVNRNLSVRLNIDNVFDKLYATSANWPGTRVFLGPPRSFMVSADPAF